MKKILTASLVAMMAVSAANADIASTNYVTKSIEALDGSTATTGTKSGKYVVTVSQTDGTVGSATVGFDTTITKESDDTNAPTSKAVYDVIDALDADSVGGEGSYIKLVSQADGKLSATPQELIKTKEAIVVDTNANIAPSAGAVVEYVTEKISEVDGDVGQLLSDLETLEEAVGVAQVTADKAVVANADIIAGTGTKITYDKKGLVTGSEDLVESDIPTLSASKITNLGNITAANMGTTATTVVDAIKEVAKEAADAQETADKAVVANADIIAGTGTKITYDKKGLVTGSEDLVESDIPTLSQGKISGLSDSLKAKLDKTTLTNATKAGTGETNTTADGTYTLTMKVSNGNQTYIWEKIGR